jgi:hypothetical protein
MASAFRTAGVHHCPPPTAAHHFLKYAMVKLNEYQNDCESVNPSVHRLTPLGTKWYNDSGDHSSLVLTNLENIRTDSCQSHITAERRGHGPNTQVIIVTQDEASCDCCHHNMTDSLCRHIRYGLLSLDSAMSFRLTEEQKRHWLINVFPPVLYMRKCTLFSVFVWGHLPSHHLVGLYMCW